MTTTTADILIVEDDTALNEAYVTILTSAGHSVRTSFNGQEALSIIGGKDPDIIFLDLRMPVLDGLGFLKAYQPLLTHPDVDIIVFSNYDMQQEVDEAYSLGAQRYVLKAWATPKELIKIVKDTMENKALNEAVDL